MSKLMKDLGVRFSSAINLLCKLWQVINLRILTYNNNMKILE